MEENREIAISFNAEIGTIDTSRFAELKAWAEEVTAPYMETVVAPERIRDAKDDLAYLRKAQATLESERKRIKKLWNEPYATFEEKYKDATKGLSDAIDHIDSQVKAIESEERSRQAEAVRQEILGDAKDMSPLLCKLMKQSDKLFQRTYKDEYANKSCSRMKARLEWRQILVQMVEEIKAIGNQSQLLMLYAEKGTLAEAQIAYDALKKIVPEPEMPRIENAAKEPRELLDDDTKTVRMRRVYIGQKYKCLMLLDYARELGLTVEKE